MGDALVVAILYPLSMGGGPAAQEAERRSLEAIDPRVRVIVEPYEEPHSLRTLRGLSDGPEVRALAPPLTSAQRRALAEAEIIISLDLPFDMAELAPRLRWVQTIGAGTGQIQQALNGTDVVITHNGGANAVGIAEFAFARLLQHRKRFRELDRAQDAHDWGNGLGGTTLDGKTLGLLGLGSIASAVAVRARAFGMEVLACRRSAAPSELVDELFPSERLLEMLARSDAVIAAVPETPDTVGRMDAAAFSAMPAGAFFCNVGRGTLVDEPALIAALESGHLGGAALDVASVEPLPAEHPLWNAPNLYLSPHCSTSRDSFFRNVQRNFRENLARYAAGQPLRGVVDRARGY